MKKLKVEMDKIYENYKLDKDHSWASSHDYELQKIQISYSLHGQV